MKTFDDIYGYQHEKQRLRMICDMLRDPGKYLAMGVTLPRGLLINGAPGLGKTLMAQALIDESGWKCIICRKDSGNKGEFVQSVRDAFAQAKQKAPCILLLDDMDKYAENRRGDGGNKAEYVAIQTCMDELTDERVFVIATTNDSELLANSLLRAGRFGRQIELSNPTQEQLRQILPKMLDRVDLKGDVDIRTLAYACDDMTCAEIEDYVRTACEYAAYEGKTAVERDHFKSALLQKEGWTLYPDNTAPMVKRAAYHEAGHALAALLLGDIVRYTVIAAGVKGSGVCGVSPQEPNSPLEAFERHVMVLLAGRAAVEIAFGEVDLNARLDVLRANTDVEFYLTEQAGKGFEYVYDRDVYASGHSHQAIHEIMQRTHQLTAVYYERVKQLLAAAKPRLDSLARGLIEHGILLHDEVLEIVGEAELCAD